MKRDWGNRNYTTMIVPQFANNLNPEESIIRGRQMKVKVSRRSALERSEQASVYSPSLI